MIIISVVGADRPGIIYAVASELADARCHIEDTTMTRLSGEFAMIFLVSPPSETNAETLMQCLARVAVEQAISINCKVASHHRSTPAMSGATRWSVSAYGAQSTPLLAGISRVLAAHSVNITDLQSRIHDERKVYVMVFEVEIPPDLTAGVLRSALEAAAAEVGAQVSLNPRNEDEE